MWAQEKGLGKLEALVEDTFDGPHGLKKALLISLRELAEHLGHLLARAVVEQGEGVLTIGGQGKEALARVDLRTDLVNKTSPFKAGQDAAEVTRVKAQLAR